MRGSRKVPLTTGGWIDLDTCRLLWAHGTLFYGPLLMRYWPAGAFRERRRFLEGLFLTSNGNYVVKEYSGGGKHAVQLTHRQVTSLEAYLWLLQKSHRHAKRLFPDESRSTVGER